MPSALQCLGVPTGWAGAGDPGNMEWKKHREHGEVF
jgi:hypothetical protein